MSSFKPLFKRDGELRDTTKPILDFLRPIPTSSPSYNLFEKNQHLFFETLGESFSKCSMFVPRSDLSLTQIITRMNLEKKCHDTAEKLFMIYGGRFDLIWGIVDSYDEEAKYEGTFIHSFLREKSSHVIIDPFIVKYAHLNIPVGFSSNYFGVIIPELTLMKLAILGSMEQLNFSGSLQKQIFPYDDHTRVVIQEILKTK